MTSKFDNLDDALSYVRVLQKPITLPGLNDTPKPRRHPIPRRRERELVAGGDPVREPVDRTAAMVIAKAPWWGLPPEENNSEKIKMSDAANGQIAAMNRGAEKRGGLTIHRINGEERLDYDEVCQLVMDQISKLPKDTRPLVVQARDARGIMRELCEGIGSDMEKFKENMKVHLEDVRRYRGATLVELGQIMTALKDVRGFFMDADYHSEIERLRDFVEVCERLKALKESGFLDDVAETMLKLATPRA